MPAGRSSALAWYSGTTPETWSSVAIGSGSPALDVAALAELIVLVGRVMAGNPQIREIDLNPVIVHPEGEGVLALDALMLVD